MGKRRKARGKYNLVDRISALPDDILVSIVSFLEIKEAAATSILSRRWQNVWEYTMTLNLERTDFFAGDAFRRFKSLMEKLRYRRSHNYVDWVDGVLKHHRGKP
ncbi:putative F-box domain-containing protein [Rosa chinensis]|uniref:Putative F-box domain-containing protein n=1 Tax=Rosa chinensis TaxID=74649 RepID=A0A2P6R5B7_ROSCH|nr:putative F-box domain-containing protein [Rosa chinensis]